MNGHHEEPAPTPVAESNARRRRSWPDRNPLGVPYFPVPIELIESGLWRQMGNCELRRYVTLLRISNYLGKLSFSVGYEWLGTMDGVSPSSAFRVNKMLEKRGLVHIERDRNPTRYTLNLLSEWKKPMAGIKLTGTADNVTTKGRGLEVPKWGEIADRQISWK